MDGIIKELLRLEGTKREALIDLDAEAYEASVRAQALLAEDPRLGDEARDSRSVLMDFSQLARLNSVLYSNLMATTSSWISGHAGYSGSGYAESAPVGRRLLGSA